MHTRIFHYVGIHISGVNYNRRVHSTRFVLKIPSGSTHIFNDSLFQDFTLDFYFRQFWTDPRLAFRKQPAVETLSVGSEFIKNIWVPDTFFVNEKQSYFHVATTSNEFIRIHHSGSITRSIRWVSESLSSSIQLILLFFSCSVTLISRCYNFPTEKSTPLQTDEISRLLNIFYHII